VPLGHRLPRHRHGRRPPRNMFRPAHCHSCFGEVSPTGSSAAEPFPGTGAGAAPGWWAGGAESHGHPEGGGAGEPAKRRRESASRPPEGDRLARGRQRRALAADLMQGLSRRIKADGRRPILLLNLPSAVRRAPRPTGSRPTRPDGQASLALALLTPFRASRHRAAPPPSQDGLKTPPREQPDPASPPSGEGGPRACASASPDRPIRGHEPRHAPKPALKDPAPRRLKGQDSCRPAELSDTVLLPPRLPPSEKRSFLNHKISFMRY
jgi:hypothetical protein